MKIKGIEKYIEPPVYSASGEDFEKVFLIAAVIGDLKEAEHRAKFSERALNCLARSFAEAMCKYGDDTHYLVDGFIQDAYRRAEKELAEEKDEQD